MKSGYQKVPCQKIKEATVKKERTYGINSLNLADTAHADNDSVLGEEKGNGHASK